MEEKKYYNLPKEIREECRKPFPPEAMSTGSKSFLTAISAQYIIERLNDVFGLLGWNYEHEIVSDPTDYVVIKGRLIFHKYGLTTPFQYGGHKKTGTGTEAADGYKSAVTDGLTKCASYIEIGNDVFKGLVKPPNSGNTRTVQGATKAKTDDGKPWLNPKTEEWKSAVEWLAGGGTLIKIQEKYKIGKDNKELLIASSIDQAI